MPLKKLGLALLIGCFLTQPQAATLQESFDNRRTVDEGFWSKGAEGWFWYKDPTPEPEPLPLEMPEPPKPEPEKVAEPEKQEPVKDPEYLEPFTLAWTKQNLQKYLEIAWNNPTHDNVKSYFLLQRFLIDRASAFSDMAQQVVIGNKLLDESMSRPLSTMGTRVVAHETDARLDALMNRIAKRAGIFFFYKSDCRYCEVQGPMVEMLNERYGFHIIAVSIDGGELQSVKFPDTRVDQGQARALGVTATPSIFLMNENGEFDLLAVSMVAYTDLRDRILLAAKRTGLITEQEFNTTKPIMNPDQQIDLSKELPKLLKAATNPMELFGDEASSKKLLALRGTETIANVADSKGFIAPEKLLELLGDKAKTRRSLASFNQASDEPEPEPVSIRFVN